MMSREFGPKEKMLLHSQQNQETPITSFENFKSENLWNQTTKQKQSTYVLVALRSLLYFIYKALNIGYIPLFIYRAFEKSKRCSHVNNKLLKIPVSKLTEKIQNGEVSCEEVVKSYIFRIKEVNPILNAVIDDRFNEAIEEACNVDKFVASEEFQHNKENIAKQYPLLGVPLTVKGSIGVKGLKHTSGMVKRKEFIAEDDAVPVHLARKAGAIILLTSNVPELCMNWETTNNLHGTTKNPYDSTRSAGGSSGGEASLLGSGASLIGIGSDIAGSLRLPAHYCGVWGHKPTAGVVSYEGHFPSCKSHDEWQAVFTLGPMARYAKDLRILLGVIAKPEKRDALKLDKQVTIKNIKVYYSKMDHFLWQKPNTPCVKAVEKVVAHFNTIAEIPPQKVDFQLLKYSTEIASLLLLEIKDVDNIFDNDGNGFSAELLRFLTGGSKHCLSTVFYGFLRKLYTKIPVKLITENRDNLTALKKEFENTLGEDGVFVLPTFPVEAYKHGDWIRYALSSGYMSIFNALGFPVTNCPIGKTEDGMPIGVQVAHLGSILQCQYKLGIAYSFDILYILNAIFNSYPTYSLFKVVGLPYKDKLTLAVAEQLEKNFGGWSFP